MMKNRTLILDKDLRRNIHELGTLLGEIIVEQEGIEIFDIVEDLRLLTKSYRSNSNLSDKKRIKKIVNGLTEEKAHKIVKAFHIYFLLVNAADEVHQIKQTKSKKGRVGSTDSLFERLLNDGMTENFFSKMVEEIEVVPVFTAHPTEATRQTILRKILRISTLLLVRNTG